MSAPAKLLGFDEIAKHNGRDDCWLIICDKVYNVTSFMDDHPGGDEILLTATGKDATSDFEDVGHSSDAIEIMNTLYIGEVDVSSIPVKHKPKKAQPMSVATEPAQSSGFLIKLLQFMLPLVILGLAFVFKKFKKEE